MDTDEKTSLSTLEISLHLRTEHSSCPCNGVPRRKTLLTLFVAFSRESNSGCDTINALKHLINQSEKRILQI